MVDCSNSGRNTEDGTIKPPDRQTFTTNRRRLNSGKLKFRFDGLKNELTSHRWRKSYTHSATIVVTGEPQYTKGVYVPSLFRERLSGGDPEKNRAMTILLPGKSSGMGSAKLKKQAVIEQKMKKGPGEVEIRAIATVQCDTDKTAKPHRKSRTERADRSSRTRQNPPMVKARIPQLYWKD